MTDYRETIYTCPSCGTAVKIPEFGDELPATEPILLCPRCGCFAYRTSSEEQYVLQSFCRCRREANTIITSRNVEKAAGDNRR
ncbi:hypothetical protein [Methanorbis rubei]|uniref:Uncharacterized protein n=1 Tax=Methanorbis rubei TaxID=3028300 RepID=A0AAE4MHI5_9EURY|nr:hypothetical protein [Methanocorpusculaceae archaeon Cs1]